MKFGEDPTFKYANFIIQPEGTGTKLSWDIEPFDMPFIMRGMLSMIGMQKKLDDNYQQGMSNFKSMIEAKH